MMLKLVALRYPARLYLITLIPQISMVYNYKDLLVCSYYVLLTGQLCPIFSTLGWRLEEYPTLGTDLV
jgi:hypothetical protein